MIELAKTAAMKFLFGGNAEAAIPAALQCLKFSSEVYGSASVELVIPYLLIAEANICELTSYHLIVEIFSHVEMPNNEVY